ncbi:hypothetical protein [Oleiagrimonas soli]|uniref:Uncharacterized protein n=1 Tax=Oleiagrimonas soli TaxID=1543381 RepID=A0A099CUU7_9GAMM|nr:hypothetical protein [Oleiagrimonas soli]KGI77524.1 hypothetical protein LF63_0109305 [Oleiagrimonas soli]MBB6183008.1 hypothetical protein [Oleiagrimonas soli]
MNESIAIQPPPIAPPAEPRSQSGLGIASFVLGLLDMLLLIVMFFMAVAINVNNGGVSPGEDDPQTIMLGLFVILIGIFALVGLGLGIAATVQTARRRALGITGLCLNGAVCLLIVLLLIIGLTAS